MKKKRKLDEVTPYISNLLEGRKYEYNRIPYQQIDTNSSTCGDHTTYYVYNVLNSQMTLDDYHEHMKRLKSIYHVPYDYIVAEWVKSFT